MIYRNKWIYNFLINKNILSIIYIDVHLPRFNNSFFTQGFSKFLPQSCILSIALHMITLNIVRNQRQNNIAKR